MVFLPYVATSFSIPIKVCLSIRPSPSHLLFLLLTLSKDLYLVLETSFPHQRLSSFFWLDWKAINSLVGFCSHWVSPLNSQLYRSSAHVIPLHSVPAYISFALFSLRQVLTLKSSLLWSGSYLLRSATKCWDYRCEPPWWPIFWNIIDLSVLFKTCPFLLKITHLIEVQKLVFA